MLSAVMPRAKMTKLEKSRVAKVDITKDTPVVDVVHEATLARLVKFLAIETPNGGDVVDCLYGPPFADPLNEYEAYLRSINVVEPPFKALDDVQRLSADEPRLKLIVAFARLRAGEVLQRETDRKMKSPDVLSATHDLLREAKVESKDEETVQKFTAGQIAALCIVLVTAVVAAIVYLISAFTFRREMDQIVKRHFAAAKQAPGPFCDRGPNRSNHQVPRTAPVIVQESASIEEAPLQDERVPEGKKVNRQQGHDKKMDRLTGSNTAKGSTQIKRGGAKPISSAQLERETGSKIFINPNQYDALRHLWQLNDAHDAFKLYSHEIRGKLELPMQAFRDGMRAMGYAHTFVESTSNRFSAYVLFTACLDYLYHNYGNYSGGDMMFPKRYGWMNGKIWLGDPGAALPGHTTLPALVEHCNNLLADPNADLHWNGTVLSKSNVLAPTKGLLAKFSENLLKNKVWIAPQDKNLAEMAIYKHKNGEPFLSVGAGDTSARFGDEDQAFREAADVHETTTQSVEEINTRKEKRAEKKKAKREKKRAAKAALSAPKSDSQAPKKGVKPTLVPPVKSAVKPSTPPSEGKKESASVSGHFTVPEGMQHGVIRVRVGSQLSTGAIVKYPGYGNVFQMTRHGLEDDLPKPGQVYHFEELAFWHEGKLTAHSDIKLKCVYLGKENVQNDDLALFHAGVLASKMVHQYPAGNLIDDQRVKVFGYSGVKIGSDPVGHLRHGDGTVHAVHSKAHPLELLWDSETFNGMSGSVLLASSGDKFFVGGMHTAGYDKQKTPAALRYNRAIRCEDILNVLKSLPAKN
jgi:hypothetical protein